MAAGTTWECLLSLRKCCCFKIQHDLFFRLLSVLGSGCGSVGRGGHFWLQRCQSLYNFNSMLVYRITAWALFLLRHYSQKWSFNKKSKLVSTLVGQKSLWDPLFFELYYSTVSDFTKKTHFWVRNGNKNRINYLEMKTFFALKYSKMFYSIDPKNLLGKLIQWSLMIRSFYEFSLCCWLCKKRNLILSMTNFWTKNEPATAAQRKKNDEKLETFAEKFDNIKKVHKRFCSGTTPSKVKLNNLAPFDENAFIDRRRILLKIHALTFWLDRELMSTNFRLVSMFCTEMNDSDWLLHIMWLVLTNYSALFQHSIAAPL